MSPDVINLVCPGCGSPISSNLKECEYCGRPLVIQNFKTIVDMDKPLTNKYVNEYRKILANDPYNPEINKAMGLGLLKLGLYDQAIEMFDKASTYDLTDSDTLFFSAIALLRGKRPAFVKRNDIDAAMQKIEAAKAIECKGVYDYMMAVIKYDYFRRKGFKINPDYTGHLALADEAGYSDADVDELNSILGFDSRNLPEVD